MENLCFLFSLGFLFSLEEKHVVVEGKLVGNFIVSGEYKIHEISLNKEKFNFKKDDANGQGY